MKKPFFIFTLLSFSLIITSMSYAQWTLTSKSEGDEEIYYVDFERIRKVDGYHYFWVLVDFVKPDKDGDLSIKNYRKGDCKLFQIKDLQFEGYRETMGTGRGKSYKVLEKEWYSPTPNSINEVILNKVCNY